MTYDLKLNQSWEDQNCKVREILGVSETEGQLGVYHGVSHALIDILYGLKEFWPLKKSLVVVTDGDPHINACLRIFVREAYSITQVRSSDISKISDWISTFKSDTLAVIYSGDHAFSGALLLPSELAEQLSLKKIYSIEIQHSLHAYLKRPVYPWQVQVQHFSPDLAVVIQGARVKLFKHLAPILNWTQRNLVTELKTWKQSKIESMQIIKKFEAEFSKQNQWGVHIYFGLQNEARLWDRSLLFVDNLGGDHIIHRLAEKLGFELPFAGFSDLIETTHLCRWHGGSEFGWWGENNFKIENLKSLIAISTVILERENFFNLFTEVISSCHKETELL